jgi:predicted  nucleic acid-binding Zn-ribbon protein
MGLDIGPEELAQTLREMQDLDTRVFGLEREIEALADKHQLGELEAELSEVRGSQASSEAQLEELEHRQHKLDGELDLLVGKVKKEEGKLFSGTIMNPKELSAIQAEIFSLRKKRDEMETEDLEEMEGIDALRAEIASAKERTALMAEKERQAKSAHDADLEEKRSEIASLSIQRNNLKVKLPPEIAQNYEKLLEDKGGLAVVPILMGRSCGGCHIDFSRSQIDRFQHNEGVFRCEYCRRILVK